MSEGTSAPLLEERFVFTGEGAEYFRIWVFNAVLSILTIGIYSAWAKVRKSSYFARNTQLAGDTFEFVAEPLAILRGRLLAVVLLGLYTYSFDFSLTLGLATTAILLAVAPLLFASATRFRLRNTRWRGLRFDFRATHSESYRAITVVVAVWISGGVVAAVAGEEATLWYAALTVLLVPWLHHRIKAFQHRHVAFAGNRSSFAPALGRFYRIYVVTLLLIVLVAVGAFAVTGAAASLLSNHGEPAARTVGIFVGIAVPALAWLAAWPYLATHIQRVVWERTTLGPFSFRTSIAVQDLLPIAAKNLGLLVLTGGFYWPFAAIAWARYRVGCMHLIGTQRLGTAAALDPRASTATLGEGAIEFFGVDVGW